MRRSTRSVIAITAALLSLGGGSVASAAKGSGGGAGGGGGGGGGGTTPTPTVSVGSIRQVSTAAACTAGSTIGVTLRKGFDKRVEVQLNMLTVAAGTWEIHVDNVTTGQPVLGMATSLPANSILLTSLGATVPVGASDITFVATRRDLGTPMLPDFPMTPVVETCTARLTVVGR